MPLKITETAVSLFLDVHSPHRQFCFFFIKVKLKRNVACLPNSREQKKINSPGLVLNRKQESKQKLSLNIYTSLKS